MSCGLQIMFLKHGTIIHVIFYLPLLGGLSGTKAYTSCTRSSCNTTYIGSRSRSIGGNNLFSLPHHIILIHRTYIAPKVHVLTDPFLSSSATPSPPRSSAPLRTPMLVQFWHECRAQSPLSSVHWHVLSIFELLFHSGF